MSRWAALGEDGTRELLRCVDEVLGLSRGATLGGEDALGLFRCVGEALGVSCWLDAVWELSCWAVCGEEEARGVLSCVEVAWATLLWAERRREEAWGAELRSPLCGVAEEAWVGADRFRSKKCPLSPRSFAQCCPALRLPPPVSKERRGRFEVRGVWFANWNVHTCTRAHLRGMSGVLAWEIWLIPPEPWPTACNLGPCHQVDSGDRL